MTATSAQKLHDDAGNLLPQWYDSAADVWRLVSDATPQPSRPTPYTITQTTLAVTGTSQVLIAANAARKYLAWMIIGAQDVTISPATPAVVGVGMVYQANGAGLQGASEEFPNGAPTNAWYAIAATTGSTVIVWEGA